MLKKKKNKNPLTKAQNQLLRISLKRLLGDGLIKESSTEKTDGKRIILKDALNAVILE